MIYCQKVHSAFFLCPCSTMEPGPWPTSTLFRIAAGSYCLGHGCSSSTELSQMSSLVEDCGRLHFRVTQTLLVSSLDIDLQLMREKERLDKVAAWASQLQGRIPAQAGGPVCSRDRAVPAWESRLDRRSILLHVLDRRHCPFGCTLSRLHFIWLTHVGVGRCGGWRKGERTPEVDRDSWPQLMAFV